MKILSELGLKAFFKKLNTYLNDMFMKKSDILNYYTKIEIDRLISEKCLTYKNTIGEEFSEILDIDNLTKPGLYVGRIPYKLMNNSTSEIWNIIVFPAECYLNGYRDIVQYASLSKDPTLIYSRKLSSFNGEIYNTDLVNWKKIQGTGL